MEGLAFFRKDLPCPPSFPSLALHPDNSSSEPVSPEVSDAIAVKKSPSRIGPLGLK